MYKLQKCTNYRNVQTREMYKLQKILFEKLFARCEIDLTVLVQERKMYTPIKYRFLLVNLYTLLTEQFSNKYSVCTMYIVHEK